MAVLGTPIDREVTGSGDSFVALTACYTTNGPTDKGLCTYRYLQNSRLNERDCIRKHLHKPSAQQPYSLLVPGIG